MSILKKEYELSVWNEELIDGVKKESRGITIGADSMTHLGRATSPKLVRSVKGTNTLTFQMPTKYFDSEKGEYVKNELLEDLYNERKLKLHYDGKWYEFYIKSIQEDKQYKSIMKTITCTDSFIDELSRTGYEIEFSPDLNNSVEEVGTFMETKEGDRIKGSSKAILDDSVWDYRPEMNTGDFTEFNEQRFYKIPLKQFGGKIVGYKINLEVDESDFKTGTEEEKEQRAYLRNPYTYEKRPLEYGDDQARVEELFYDPYEKDNGRALLSDDNLVELSGDYIYVPMTDLSYIMGAVYKSASTSLEEPAIYGAYKEDESNTIYALQPASENPKDVIQFIFFNEDDEVLIDEEGVVANNNCHYVITIEQWNELLKKQLSDNTEGLIHWTSPYHNNDNTYTLTKLYTTSLNKNKSVVYTTKVFPSSATIDNFNWYPVYYEGYLDKIADTEVSKARKISITDRTELNLNADTYVTVYNQKDTDFSGLYSEDELNDLIAKREELRAKKTLTAAEAAQLEKINNDFRVCSKLNTRLIVPSLARNLVENGTKITDTNGWEAKTQNINHDLFDTGSYRKMLEINIQQTVKTSDDGENLILSEADLTGGTSDEGVSDYYLELLSPCLDKGDDLSVNGMTFTDYAINFGMVGQEKTIEKDKVYAIRLTTGTWHTTDYNFVYRYDDSIIANGDTPYSYDDTDVAAYKEALEKYRSQINKLKDDSDFKKKSKSFDLTTEKGKTDADTYLLGLLTGMKKKGAESVKDSYVDSYYIVKEPTYTDTQAHRNSSDLPYLKYVFLSVLEGVDLETAISSTATSFYYAIPYTEKVLQSEIDNLIIENKVFDKRNNVDLDKVVIGEGSTNLQGNYVIDGIDNTSAAANFISFADLADESSVKLCFLPDKNSLPAKTTAKTYLTNPLYYRLDKNSETPLDSRWQWVGSNTSNDKDKYSYVEDNAYVLFRAKKTIKNPYIAIKLESGPAQIRFDDIKETSYTKNSGIGVKICAATAEGAAAAKELSQLLTDEYSYLQNSEIEIYQIDKSHFSEAYCNSVHFNDDDMTISAKSGDTADSFGVLTDSSFKSSSTLPSAKGTTSLTDPYYFTRIRIPEEKSKKTLGYALFVDGIYYGVFWLEKK